ncbi:dipeptide epimerase [Gaoshiqia sediminis]|uniref:Dipeptide epimerase n=1 Tax=Gaoshiqia sediminis TaxID=2986998 RepID=A0AA42C9K0_9BACT|nr:dipeptide epimerase [Gaoshiqia sediminis]MCW0482255.1 dipeptide epimerase [Gaoshiqia sediminis]
MKHTFTLANSSRQSTPIMLTEIEYDGFIGYGEASMPPYLGENQQSAAQFLSQLNLSQFHDPFRIEEILSYTDRVQAGNTAAKAAVDIALHDLTGKLIGKPWHSIWGLNAANTPYSSFTIGIDQPEIVTEKVKDASSFNILKVKLGAGNDREMIHTIRSVTNVPLCVDVNQGWTDKQQALEQIYWLKEQGVVFVEQPMPKHMTDEMAWLTAHSPLPTIADESVQRLSDIASVYQVYSGINIKLMKCTGMLEASNMISAANALNMKIMIGCMTETSCAISAAAQLSPLCHWADLDGNLLITNDLFDGIKIVDGKVSLNELPGIGIKPKG